MRQQNCTARSSEQSRHQFSLKKSQNCWQSFILQYMLPMLSPPKKEIDQIVLNDLMRVILILCNSLSFQNLFYQKIAGIVKGTDRGQRKQPTYKWAEEGSLQKVYISVAFLPSIAFPARQNDSDTQKTTWWQIKANFWWPVKDTGWVGDRRRKGMRNEVKKIKWKALYFADEKVRTFSPLLLIPIAIVLRTSTNTI